MSLWCAWLRLFRLLRSNGCVCRTAKTFVTDFKIDRSTAAISAEEARQLLESMTANSIRIRYVLLSTFLFRFFQTSRDDPRQFLGQVIERAIRRQIIERLASSTRPNAWSEQPHDLVAEIV